MSAITLGKNRFVGIRLHLELGFDCLVMAFPETVLVLVLVLMLDMMSVRTAPDTLECCLIYANSVEEMGFSLFTLRISCEVGLCGLCLEVRQDWIGMLVVLQERWDYDALYE
jgi:hypothetical protein